MSFIIGQTMCINITIIRSKAKSEMIKLFVYYHRLVYSSKKPTKDQMTTLEQLIEELHYVCGGDILPDGHALQELFAIQTNVTCDTDISYHYFSSHLKLPIVCYKCGSTDDLIDISPEEKQKYQAIHTVCTHDSADQRKWSLESGIKPKLDRKNLKERNGHTQMTNTHIEQIPKIRRLN